LVIIYFDRASRKLILRLSEIWKQKGVLLDLNFEILGRGRNSLKRLPRYISDKQRKPTAVDWQWCDTF
jgi:hypothetical protein